MNTRSWIMVMMIVGMIGLVIPMGSASLADDIISYYKLDETTGAVVDALETNNGTNYGATRGVAGIINDAFSFDGINDYVELDDVPFRLSSNWTIAIWFKDSSFSNADTLMGKTASSNYGHSNYRLTEQGTGIKFAAYGDCSSPAMTLQSASALNDGDWHHVVGVWDTPNNKLRLYIDGVEEDNMTLTYATSCTNTGDGAMDLMFGRRAYSATPDYFSGTLDEAGIWDKPLSDAEILELYSSGAGESYPFSQFVDLNSPADDYISPTELVTFNATGIAGQTKHLANMTLYHNASGTWLANETFIYPTSYANIGVISDMSILYPACDAEAENTIIDNYVSEVNMTCGLTNPTRQWICGVKFYYEDGTTYTTPTQTSNTYSSAINFLNLYPTKKVDNVTATLSANSCVNPSSFFAEDIIIYSTFFTEYTQTWTKNFTDGATWGVEACDTSACFFSLENRSFSIDTSLPTIDIISPVNSTIFSVVRAVGDLQDINITITDTNLDTCWYDYNGVNTTFGTGGVCNNFSITLENVGTLPLHEITIWANDTAGNLNSDYTIWEYEIFDVEAVYPQTYNGNYSVGYSNWGAGQPAATTGYGAYSSTSPLGVWKVSATGTAINSICEYGDGQAYFYNSETESLGTSRANCHDKGWGWHLVQIDSEEEKDLIKEFQTEVGEDIWLNLEYNYNNDWTTWRGSYDTDFPMYYNETIETSSAYFRTNVTISGVKTIQSVKLYMNSSNLGTRSWSSTINDLGGNAYSFENTIDIPVITGSDEEEEVGYDERSFYHKITYTDSSDEVVTIREEKFVKIIFGICQYPTTESAWLDCYPELSGFFGVYGGECYETYDLSNEQGSGFFLNTLTFFNETANAESLNASFTWTLENGYLGSGTETLDNNIILYQTTETGWNGNSTICTNAWDYMNIAGTTRIQYENSDSPQRTFETTDTWDTFRTNSTLWLLPTSLGTYVTTIIENILQQALQGAKVTWTRDGFSGIIEQSLTDAAGSATFWLNPNFIYTISISKSGIGDLETTLTPTQSTYTFILGQTYNVTTDYREGVSIGLEPLDYYLNNDTTYDFNMTINSSLYDLDSYGFSVNELNGTELTNTSGGSLSAGVEGFITTSLNVGEPRKIVMNYYYNQNGTYYNYTKFYLVVDLSNTEYSIQNFFDLLKSYLNPDNDEDRMFGMSDLSFSILLFLIIFSIIGVVSYSSGLYSPVALSSISFIVVMLFDAVLGLIPEINNIPLVPTILMFVIMLGVILWETGGKN